MELASYIREENVTSITFDVLDDSIPIVEGVLIAPEHHTIKF